MRGLITFLVLVAVCVGVFALGKLRRETDGKPILHVAEEVALEVNVARAERGSITRLAQAPGDVEAVQDVDVSSEIVAKIEEMPVEEGDRVSKGDLLCRLDDKHIRAEIESAEAGIASLSAAIDDASADVEKAVRDCQRQARLSESNATSSLELRDYETRLKKAQAMLAMREHDLERAQAQLQRHKEDLERTVIRSPIDGIVSTIAAKAGEVVVTGTMNNPGTVIMTVTDLSRMQVRARIDEVEVPFVKQGQDARVYLQSDPQRPIPARVARVASKGSKVQGRDVVNFEALLDILELDESVKPGMTANVEIEVAESQDTLTIPVEAVVHRMRKELDESIVRAYDAMQSAIDISERARQAQYIKVVYVKDGEEARVRVIKPGIADSRRVEIEDGIDSEEEVIIGPYRSLDQLKDGKKVKLAEAEEKEGESEDETEEEATAAAAGEQDEKSASVAASRNP